jgi:hypothetical protein
VGLGEWLFRNARGCKKMCIVVLFRFFGVIGFSLFFIEAIYFYIYVIIVY